MQRRMSNDNSESHIISTEKSILATFAKQVFLVLLFSVAVSYTVYNFRSDISRLSDKIIPRTAQSNSINSKSFNVTRILPVSNFYMDIPSTWTHTQKNNHSKLISDEDFSAYNTADEAYMFGFLYRPGEVDISPNELLEINHEELFSEAESFGRNIGITASGNKYEEVYYKDTVNGLVIIYRDRYTELGGYLLHTQSWTLQSLHQKLLPTFDRILDSAEVRSLNEQ